ncbi:PRC-barrel domain-containing protein [Sporosarcina pasteurii]|uniref:Sporulation protein, YlmC/YmxH family n=1 Tax=Sporosarcina pasteurii TaxID=1474 RepID=A0A380BG31_SPOPA|nr:YlmC/YmxH family sporulation protein [Sporosarcina pasteurii]MDS9470507.1 YlmC/YmxH family sporulation protein [Sporosarcina pasteurii]SUJ00535.1 sporulation protein, YlmC/YmxH family [Sporosarcina pasteurii]
MKFSEIQKKEVIDATRGSFLGYVQDATIDVKNGKIETFHIGGGERALFFDSKKNDVKKVRVSDITVIGKDIVLVGKKEQKE